MRISLVAVLNQEIYRKSGTPLQIQVEGEGLRREVAVKRAVKKLFHAPELRRIRPEFITLHVGFHGHAPILDSPMPAEQSNAQQAPISLPRRRRRARYQRGSLELRGKNVKVWVGRWWEDVIVDGRMKRLHRNEILGTLEEYPTRSLARPRLDLLLERVNKRSFRPLTSLHFETFVEKWKSLILPNLQRSSRVSYRCHLNKWLLPFFGNMKMQEIYPELVQEFVSSLPLSPKTTRNVIVTLQSLWKTARAWGYVDFNCCDGIRTPRRNLVDRPFFTLEQMQRIINSSEEPYKTIYWLLAESGMRSGELCGLTVDDVDFNRGLLFVRRSVWQGELQVPKTKRAIRQCLLSPELLSHLRDQSPSWKPNEKKFLFSNRDGGPIDGDNLRKRYFYPLLKKLGIPQAGLHAFRHGNSSIMDSLSTPLKLRQDRLGHADAGFTLQTYTHIVSEDEQRLAQRFGALLKPTDAANE